jgi:hypothetical protein
VQDTGLALTIVSDIDVAAKRTSNFFISRFLRNRYLDFRQLAWVPPDGAKPASSRNQFEEYSNLKEKARAIYEIAATSFPLNWGGLYHSATLLIVTSVTTQAPSGENHNI